MIQDGDKDAIKKEFFKNDNQEEPPNVEGLNPVLANKKKIEDINESDKETRFKISKEKKKMDQLEAKRRKTSKKKVMSQARSSSKGSKISKKIKYIDLLMGLLILANFALSLYENDQYTTKITEFVCKDGGNLNLLTNLNSNSQSTTTRNLFDLYSIEANKTIDRNDSFMGDYSFNSIELENSNSTLNYSLDLDYLRNLVDDKTVDVPEKPTSKVCLNNETIVTKEHYELTPSINLIRLVIIGIIGLNEILLIVRYLFYVKLMRERYLACDKDNLITTGLLGKLLIEFFILGICIPPYAEGTIRGDMLFGSYVYSYDSIINLFQIFKFYYFIRIYANFSVWTSDKIKSLGIENGITIGAGFAIKAQIKNSPILSIFIMLAMSIGIFGFMLRILEYGYESNPLEMRVSKALNDPNYIAYSDTFWVIIITMMTVGYGDIYPDTHLGRLVAFFAILAGMFIVSLLVVTLSGIVEFTTEEKKAHNLILKMFAQENMEKISTTYVKAMMKLFLLKKSEWYLLKRGKNKKNLVALRTYVEQVLIVKELAIQFDRYMRVANSHTVPADEVLVQLENKLENDTDIIGPEIYALEDMNALTNKIIQNENQIKNAMEFLRKKQEDLISYLIKVNTIKSSVEMMEEEDKQEHSDLIKFS